ncbi:peptide-methionine (S)-S-oxide reductase MsrA [Candidatus Peribacteria bacterium]|nr:peptide-methionine (S)-S-oxide reductase MsrA [Candidatus Peribacteria bacterium]
MASCSLIPPDNQDVEKKMQTVEEYDGPTEEAVFAGGCFWCIEASFEHKDGVVAAISGFAGGEEENPTYEQVSSGTTKYREAVLVIYDPTVVSYKELVDYFWKQFDPTDDGGSFVDRGYQYTSAIFTYTNQQKNDAEQSKKELEESGVFDKPIVTPILNATTFYPAEQYHQDYYKENPVRYQYYRHGSGRDQFLEKVWGL